MTKRINLYSLINISEKAENLVKSINADFAKKQ